jgi:tRNA A37 threonylcarbamoyladenosine modification protein TsaB
MTNKLKQRKNYPTLAIHSTDNSFGFGYRKNNNLESDELFIKKFDNDLCNNLINDINKFISKEDLQKINKLSVSIGPANFNASRLIVVLARTISQQINCPLDSFSSFEIMAKRIALKNNIFTNKKSFWIYKKLKRKGFIAGKYEICNNEKNSSDLFIRETVLPKVVKELESIELSFEANYDDKEDLRELLDLSNKNLLNSNLDSWRKVLPLYPISAIN